MAVAENLPTQNILTKLIAGQALMQSTDLNPPFSSSLQTVSQIGSKIIVQNHGFPHVLFCKNSLASNVRGRAFLDIIEAQPQFTLSFFLIFKPEFNWIELIGYNIVFPRQDWLKVPTKVTFQL